MLRESRLKYIMDMLKTQGEVETQKLCELFRVSDMTIRRDLDVLVQTHHIVRTRGGAVLGQDNGISPGRLPDVRSGPELAKEQIARRALTLIEPGQRVFIDAGTTTRWMAKLMPDACQNIITTNNLAVAMELARLGDISVNVIGGQLRGRTLSCYGSQTEEQIRRYKMDVGFIGACAVSEDGYLYDYYTTEPGIKKCIIDSARQTYLLVDSSKFNRDSLINFSHVRDLAGIITDSGVDERTAERLEGLGTKLLIAEE